MYQVTFNLDPVEPLDQRVVLIADPRWKDCIEEWRQSHVFGIDTETYGENIIRRSDRGVKKMISLALNPRLGHIRLIQVGLLSDKVLVADLGGWLNKNQTNCYDEFFSILKSKMPDPSVIKVGQNIKYEMGYLRWKFGIVTRNVRDTMLMSQVLWAIGGDGDKYSHNLGAIAKRLGFEVSKDQQKSDWGGELSNSQLNYAAKDAYVVLPIAMELKKRLVSESLWDTAMVENENCCCVAEREFWGMPVDVEKLESLLRTYHKAKKDAIKPFLEEFPGVNPRSSPQIVKALNQKYNLGLHPPTSTKKGTKKGGDANKNAKKIENANKMILLENSHIPAVSSLVLFRSLSTQTDTYLRSIKENYFEGCVRSTYFQLASKGTGRSSSRDPNLQNAANHAPQWIEMGLEHPRSAFTVPKGYKLIIADLSQAHMRIATEFSQDPVLKDAFNDGQDIHLITASAQAQIRGLGLDWTPENIQKWRKDTSHENSALAEILRKTSKNINYGSLNGQGPPTLRRTMATSRDPIFVPVEETRTMIRAWKGVYNTLSATQQRIVREADSHDIELPGLRGKFGMTIGLSGRRVFFQKRHQTRGTETSYGVKFADVVSSIWLGTEAHIIKKSENLILRDLDAHPEWGWHIGNNAHDELDLWGPEEYAQNVAEMVSKHMDSCMKEFIQSIPVNETDFNPLKTICDSWSEK